MNMDTINKILYLTHDKWNSKVDKPLKWREEFKDFMIQMIERNNDCEKTLELILEYSSGEDRILIMKGVLNILEREYKEDFNYVRRRINVKKMKEELDF